MTTLLWALLPHVVALDTWLRLSVGPVLVSGIGGAGTGGTSALVTVLAALGLAGLLAATAVGVGAAAHASVARALSAVRAAAVALGARPPARGRAGWASSVQLRIPRPAVLRAAGHGPRAPGHEARSRSGRAGAASTTP